MASFDTLFSTYPAVGQATAKNKEVACMTIEHYSCSLFRPAIDVVATAKAL